MIEKTSNKMTEKDDNEEYVWTPYIKKKDGSTIWAKDYGKKAFRIPKRDLNN